MRLGRLIACAACAAALLEAPAADTSAPPSREAVDRLPVAPRRVTMAERVNRLPRAATSTDGFVRVIARDDPSDPVGFRDPILRFAADVTASLRKAFGLPLLRIKSPAVIVDAQAGRTNDVRVLVAVRHVAGRAVTRLVLPSPGYTDLEKLRFELAKATLRHYSGAEEAPDWFAQGALRAADTTLYREDARFVLKLWRRGRLPYFPALCTDLRVAHGSAAALPGFLLGRVREKRLMKKILSSLAAGEPWDGRRLAVALTGETRPAAQDRASDEQMLRLMRTVLVPGEASDEELDVFASHLQFVSPYFDRPILGNRRICSFREAVEEGADNIVLRLAAVLKMVRLPGHAVGRGEDVTAAATAYVAFLKAFAAGKLEKEELTDLLDRADLILEQAYEKNRKDNHGQG